MEIDEIIGLLDMAELTREMYQNKLRQFVLNKDFLINERFRIWSKFCDKIDYPYIVSKDEVPVIGNMVHEGLPYEIALMGIKSNLGLLYDKGRTYTWEDFLQFLGDYHEYNYDYCEDVPTIDEFRELLIKENFGSFVYDW